MLPAMRRLSSRPVTLCLLLFSLAFAVSVFQTPHAAQAAQATIPQSADITAVSGEPVVIYGQRGRKCGAKPPTFEWVVTNAITRQPTNGTLSDGGTGKRNSRRCKGEVPVRAVTYTSEPTFTGTDGVVFWDWEGVVITVKGK